MIQSVRIEKKGWYEVCIPISYFIIKTPFLWIQGYEQEGI
ncbi:hypothetical protein AMI01nite_62470 [Aneurinibacillus migulanus]|nr:hypothetical protein AMI01nite_62470 [Aneurinibacillus migulanus]